jgi:hypothetical protein
MMINNQDLHSSCSLVRPSTKTTKLISPSPSFTFPGMCLQQVEILEQRKISQYAGVPVTEEIFSGVQTSSDHG